MRIIQGIDVDALPDQFEGCVAGRTLILDGDGPCYVVSSTVKRLDTAVRNFQQAILTQMFLTKSEFCRVHLTAKDSTKAGRFDVKAIKPYQGQRTDKKKPALLEPLREAATLRQNWLPEFEVILHRDREADDGMIQDAYVYKEDGLIWSDDKDLRMTPYPYWCKKKGVVLPSQPFGWLQPSFTPSGTMKLIGQGPLFFWAQMLMGDTADHIQGVLRFNGKLCGPAAAYAALMNARDIDEAANIVIDAYRAIDQNPIPEGYLLWLQRWPGDHVVTYFNSVGLSDDNRRFIYDCYHRDWWCPTTREDSENGAA